MTALLEDQTERHVEIVRMALAEAGYPDARVNLMEGKFSSRRRVGVYGMAFHRLVVWKAYRLIDDQRVLPCSECWLAYTVNQTAAGYALAKDCPDVGLHTLDCGRDRS